MPSLRILGLAIVLLFGETASAQRRDPLLDTIDELIATLRCDEALALLPHARASRAGLLGRRALCGLWLGESGAGAMAAEALRSPRDPWVASHRDELLSALTVARRSAQESAERLASPLVRSAATAVAAMPAPSRSNDSTAQPPVTARDADARGTQSSGPPPATGSYATPARVERRCRLEGNPYHHGTEGGVITCESPDTTPPRPPVETNPYRMI